MRFRRGLVYSPPAGDHRVRDAEALGRVPGRESRDSREPIVRDGARLPAQASALGAHPREASANALLDARPLELRDRAEDAGDEPAGGRAGVDPLAQRDERDPAGVPVVEQHHQVAKVPAEPIETPAHDGLHPMGPHVGHELVERGPAVLRAADALVDVLDGGPAAGRDIPPQLEQLVLGGLVDAC